MRNHSRLLSSPRACTPYTHHSQTLLRPQQTWGPRLSVPLLTQVRLHCGGPPALDACVYRTVTVNSGNMKERSPGFLSMSSTSHLAVDLLL